jgi:hypothetical protein
MPFALLKKFGAPTTLVEPIRKLHHDFKLKFKLGTKEVLIDYSIGVKQGDNIAPALFLFLMLLHQGANIDRFYIHPHKLQMLR